MIRRLRRLGIALAVLVGLAIVADRVALRMAEDEVRDHVLARATWTGGDTSVKIGGFPFLTQVVSGEYSDVRVRAEGVELEGVSGVTAQVQLSGIHLSLSDLGQRDRTMLRVDRVEGYAQVGYDDVARRLLVAGREYGVESVKLRHGDGLLQVEVGLKIPGTSMVVPVSAVGSLTTVDGALRLLTEEVKAKGAVLPESAITAATSAMNTAFATVRVLPLLPYGMSVDSVELTDDGVRAWATARDVVI